MRRQTGPRLRPALVVAHRWLGLVMAGFLLVAGLTGSLLAWNDELDAALNPQLFHASAPHPGMPLMDPLALRERAAAFLPGAGVSAAPLRVAPGRSVAFFLDPVPGAVLADDQVFLNPYTGEVLGARLWGDIGQGRKNLMPFIYRLHYSLALGAWGELAFGGAALLWAVNCVIGAFLTFPVRPPGQPRPGVAAWLGRWKPAWRVRWSAGGHKRVFDLHRAGGLWPWAMLFIVAWSAVSFKLPQVYDPVMNALFTHQALVAALPRLPEPQAEPAMPWPEARDTGRRLMAGLAHERGFTVIAEYQLACNATRGLCLYKVRSSLDVRRHRGDTMVAFSARTGQPAAVFLPTGAASGDTVRSWLTALHMAAWGGLPLKLLSCALGLAVAMLSATGLMVWLKKRRARTMP